MTPQQFIEKWQTVELGERAAAQEHFRDLCVLLEEPTPVEADPKGEWYAFERGAKKTGGGDGWADVWKRGHFGWEYKKKGRDLDQALRQLQQYALALENPPLLVVCDMDVIRLHTNWTNTASHVYTIELTDLLDGAVRQKLKWLFTDPDQLKPGLTRQNLTEVAARKFAELAKELRIQGHNPETVAHFVNRLVFCMFAEDVNLLPNEMFKRMLEASARRPDSFLELATKLFAAMRQGGLVGFEKVEWFNGGLFDSDDALPLNKGQIRLVLDAAQMDWSDIDPSIFGTLFERGLDPDKRSQLGAHYTDSDKIMMILEPVIVRPLAAEWSQSVSKIEIELAKAEQARRRTPMTQSEARKVYAAARRAEEQALRRANRLYEEFRERLLNFRVLDPACGSGNFLYLALSALKDLEHRAGLEVEALGLLRQAPAVGPEGVQGIEINPYAAELARVSIWIGEIQWMRRNGFDVSRNPILKPLDTIECRDAIINADGSEPGWPKANVIVGNPPFLGGKRLRDVLGDEYVDALFTRYRDRVPAEADLVCYWVAKAGELAATKAVERFGLVTTNSIRGGANRTILQHIAEAGTIFDAWSDEPWVIDGAAVRVSMISVSAPGGSHSVHLNGCPAARINTDLTSGFYDLTKAQRLAENSDVAFMGDTKGGAFDVRGNKAREWLKLPSNPNGRPNSDVLRPWINGKDVTRRPADKWIIDFGWTIDEGQSAHFEAPYQYAIEKIKPGRMKGQERGYSKRWWVHERPRPEMWKALSKVRRYICTPRVSSYRVFRWFPTIVVPDSATIAFAREDDTTFGILHSRFHEAWSLRLGTSLEDRPRYTPSTTFETFPFPGGMTPNIPASDHANNPRSIAIANSARTLNELRENWLNPPEWIIRVTEVVPGYPDRLLPKDEEAAKALKKRTLTNLYNERPAWLANAHAALDAAVAAAYGWPADIGVDEALQELLTLNLKRSGKS